MRQQLQHVFYPEPVPADARATATLGGFDQKGEGWDLLKVLTNLKRDHYDAMATPTR